jgi:putative salt-induced outer membrane protein YdiY
MEYHKWLHPFLRAKEDALRTTYFVLAVVLALISPALADQIVLTNGDHLTGTIVKFDGKNLLLKSDLAGDITVAWSAVQQISSDHPLHVGLANGKTAVGVVTTQDGKFEIASTSGGPVSAAKDEMVLLRNDTEQSSYEQSLRPGLRENWQTGANVGFALTRGNSQTKSLSLAFNADRKTLHDKFSLYVNSVYATSDAGAISTTTANTEQGGLRYDHDLTPRLFGFAGADFQSDSLQSLNLRSVLGGGAGLHFIKRETTSLDLLAGLNYTHESYVALTRSFAAATLGDEFMHKLGGSTVLTQSLYFYPDLNDAGQYRTTFNFGTVTKISKWLGWQNSFGDIYVSNPPVGKKKNDILFTTGLNITFIRRNDVK